jgi:hypothetical protein
MAACILVFSPRCKHSLDLLRYLDSNPQLKQIVQLHDVTVLGIPPQYARQISRVPTLLTKNGKILVGNEVRSWLESLLPNQFDSCQIGGKCRSIGGSSFDGTDDGGSFFSLNDYGRSLQPAITPDLQEKINKKVS